MRTQADAELARLAQRFADWDCWFGIDCLWHARIKGALPPVMVRGEDAQDLADQIVRWERLNGKAD
jgi:hypothetical protein